MIHWMLAIWALVPLLFLKPVWTSGHSWFMVLLKPGLENFKHYFTSVWDEWTHWKRPWYWERLRAGGEGDDRGWDGWMASLFRWTWVWVNSGSWWWTGRPACVVHGVATSQTWRSDWTELNWIEQIILNEFHDQTHKHLFSTLADILKLIRY